MHKSQGLNPKTIVVIIMNWLNQSYIEEFLITQSPLKYWADVWKEQLIQNLKCQENNEFASFWSSKEKARDFWRKIQDQIKFYDPIFDQIQIHPGDRVLDIGGGPGTIAIPLARQGAHVTVIEPAEGMSAILTENLKKEHISGISIIRDKWENFEVDQTSELFDHVIACFSLGMPDIEESIRKMISISRGKIYLIWFSGLSSWDQMMMGICDRRCGHIYSPGPKSDLLYHVLSDMNIYPNVLNIPQVFIQKYDSLESAINQMLKQCNMTYPGKEEHVRKWVKTRFIIENGNILWKAQVTISIIQWDNFVK